MEKPIEKTLENESFSFDIQAEGDDLFASQQLPHGANGTDWERVNVPDEDLDADQ